MHERPAPDPADVGGVNAARADVFADDSAIIGIAAPVHPADVRAVGVFIGGVDRRGLNRQ